MRNKKDKGLGRFSFFTCLETRTGENVKKAALCGGWPGRRKRKNENRPSLAIVG